MSSAEAELHALVAAVADCDYTWLFGVSMWQDRRDGCSSGKAKAVQISTDRIFLTLGQNRFAYGTKALLHWHAEDNNPVNEAEYEEMPKKHEKNQMLWPKLVGRFGSGFLGRISMRV